MQTMSLSGHRATFLASGVLQAMISTNAGLAGCTMLQYVVELLLYYAALVRRHSLLDPRQLLFSIIGASKVSRCHDSSVPQVTTISADSHILYICCSEQQLHRQGSQLMQVLFQNVSTKGLALLASKVRIWLSKLPATMHLSHSLDTQPQASYSSFEIRNQKGFLMCGHIYKTAGMVLHHQTPEGLAWPMNHELGQGVAQHSTEKQSWKALIAGVAFARLRLSGIKGVPNLLISGAITSLASLCMVNIWLVQNFEFEADEIGAAISKAAGCSSGSILNAIAIMYSWQSSVETVHAAE